MTELHEIHIRNDLPGWRCPHCGGSGRLPDGSCSVGPTVIRVRPASICYVCKGKGRVMILPLED